MAAADGGAPMGWREIEGGRCARSERRGRCRRLREAAGKGEP